MKKTITLLSLGLGVTLACSLSSHAQNAGSNDPAPSSGFVRCASAQYEDILRAQDPDYDKKRAEALQNIQASIDNKIKNGLPVTTSAVYTIPVVFHVVYKTTAENVSDTRIKQMLDQMNMDWSRTNTDAGNTPAVWQSIAVDVGIRFCLAAKDPSGNATTGIVHKATTTASFSVGTAMKHNSSGGDDAWDPTKYMNVWICNISGGILGFANFPPVGADYGTVVHYCSVGSLANPNGTCPPYHMGRTLSHEIGHNFTLNHIWDGGCPANGDGVTDTPGQQAATSGCPSGVKTDACQTAAPGIMYQNYMDYTDDACYNMFTNGQKTKIQNTTTSYLMSLVNAVPTVCSTTDVADNTLLENISIFPNPSTGEVSINTLLQNANPMDLKVYNAIGENVISKRVIASSTKVDLSSNPNGIYLFEIKTTDGTITKKVIVNR